MSPLLFGYLMFNSRVKALFCENEFEPPKHLLGQLPAFGCDSHRGLLVGNKWYSRVNRIVRSMLLALDNCLRFHRKETW